MPMPANFRRVRVRTNTPCTNLVLFISRSGTRAVQTIGMMAFSYVGDSPEHDTQNQHRRDTARHCTYLGDKLSRRHGATTQISL